MKITKEDIIEKIKSTAEQNNNIPLGAQSFANKTGIKKYHWSKYWSKFSDAQKEAGFVPNKKHIAYPEELILKEFILLIRKLNKFPTYSEVGIEVRDNQDKPSQFAMYRLGTNNEIADKILKYCKDIPDCCDVIDICREYIANQQQKQSIKISSEEIKSKNIGEVYLFKSGKYYKIGKTRDMVRRGTEIRIQLPEELILIHSIKTDDVSGIESYWHKRFAEKRMKGEWFDLNANDIKAFKRWKRIF